MVLSILFAITTSAFAFEEMTCPEHTVFKHVKNGAGFYEEYCEKVLADGTTVKDGQTRQWYDLYRKFQRSDGRYQDGMETGLWVWWNRDGRKDSEEYYRRAKLDGKVTSWYRGGQIQSEKVYKDGVLHGLQKEWYSGGQKKSEILFSQGSRHGRLLEWHENGRRKRDVGYSFGVENGSAYEWSIDGRFVQIRTFINGVVVHFEQKETPSSAKNE